jgi:solute carrier family 25 folate transporter 32
MNPNSEGVDAGDGCANTAKKKSELLSKVSARKVTVASKQRLFGNFLAGISGGLVSSFITHPLDVVLTRMQAQDGRSHVQRYKSTVNALFTIVRNEGFQNLYAGIIPALVGSTASWGIYFLGYNYLRSLTRKHFHGPQSEHSDQAELSPLSTLSCAVATGCVSTVITQPIWLIKTRLQLQHQGSHIQYTGMIHCFTNIVENEGASALFRSCPLRSGCNHGRIDCASSPPLTNAYSNSPPAPFRHLSPA